MLRRSQGLGFHLSECLTNQRQAAIIVLIGRMTAASRNALAIEIRVSHAAATFSLVAESGIRLNLLANGSLARRG
jgi:hypothetical protein